MIRNKSLGKRLLAAGIMLIFSMSGCGTDNKIELTGNGIGSDGIEAAATVDSAEVAAAGETASDVTGGDAASTGTAEDTNKTAPTPAPAPRQELTTADRMVDRTKVKGIYVTGPKAGSAGMEELIGLVDETELNAMVIDVKNDEGNVTFRLMNEEITQNIPVLDQISEMQAGVCYIRDIQALMQELKDHNIYTIARIVCFKDPILAAARPELALTKPDGKPVTDANGLAWVNPYRQEVWEYLTELAEMAADLGFDEIQYDYVRFPVGSDANVADYGVDMDAYPKRQAMQGSVEELQEIPEAERAVVRPWLQAFTATWVPGHISYNGTQIREQIQAVYDAGYEEWILWNATNRYSAEGLLGADEVEDNESNQ